MLFLIWLFKDNHTVTAGRDGILSGALQICNAGNEEFTMVAEFGV
jgi:hypothetical protein